MASATQPVVSLEDYLRMSFEGPSPEFVNGEIVERGMTMYPHAKAQSRCVIALHRPEAVSYTHLTLPTKIV